MASLWKTIEQPDPYPQIDGMHPSCPQSRTIPKALLPTVQYNCKPLKYMNKSDLYPEICGAYYYYYLEN